MKVAIIGLGLIGGSLGLEFSKNHRVYGLDKNQKHQELALQLGLISATIPFEKLHEMEAVVIAVPVDKTPKVVMEVLDIISDKTLVFDVGSTKENVCNYIKNHLNRKQFLATHPIAGTEFSGPNAAIKNLFTNKVNIICEKQLTDTQQFEKFIHLMESIPMRYVFMASAKQHDKHIAYVSHLSHISSFMLGKTVLEIEKEEETIFNMAGSGFESTVRLAKSSPNTWTPIFLQNKKHIINSLDEYINNLQDFKKMLLENDQEKIYNSLKETNRIKKILP